MTQHLADVPEPRSRDEVERQAERFLKWADSALPYRVAYKRENGEWYALAVDYDVTGKGHTLREAFDELWELVIIYLVSYFREDQPVEAAKRPVPLALRAQIKVGSLISEIVDGINRKPPRAGQLRASAPSSAVERTLVAC